ncbi:MAG: hypothetical protein IPM60_15175 [Rhodospirillales bacterium]|nr:hypothetical protein [Rhodospirillales bacterium]
MSLIDTIAAIMTDKKERTIGDVMVRLRQRDIPASEAEAKEALAGLVEAGRLARRSIHKGHSCRVLTWALASQTFEEPEAKAAMVQKRRAKLLAALVRCPDTNAARLAEMTRETHDMIKRDLADLKIAGMAECHHRGRFACWRATQDGAGEARA